MESLEAPQCQLDFSPIYSITSSIVSFFLPCIIMLIIYFHLFAIAKHHLKEMKYVKSLFFRTRANYVNTYYDYAHFCFRAHSRPLYRLQVLQDAQQKHEELSHAGHTDVIIKDNVEINGGSTKTKLKNDKTKKSTIVTFSDSPLIQEHKVSFSFFFVKSSW